MCMMRKNIYLMILTFIIISVTIVTAALVQLEQFKTSSHYALNKLRSNHPDLSINLRYIELHDLPPGATEDQMLKAISNGTHIDIVSLDEIWLGEVAEKGLLKDLTNYTEKWG